MRCLYRNDYGPPDPGFDPLAGKEQLIQGFGTHAAELVQARNLGQLEAMERKLQRGEEIRWCDQGYGWTYEPGVEGFIVVAAILLLLPYAAWKIRRRRGRTATSASRLAALEG